MDCTRFFNAEFLTLGGTGDLYRVRITNRRFESRILALSMSTHTCVHKIQQGRQVDTIFATLGFSFDNGLTGRDIIEIYL